MSIFQHPFKGAVRVVGRGRGKGSCSESSTLCGLMTHHPKQKKDILNGLRSSTRKDLQFFLKLLVISNYIIHVIYSFIFYYFLGNGKETNIQKMLPNKFTTFLNNLKYYLSVLLEMLKKILQAEGK